MSRILLAILLILIFSNLYSQQRNLHAVKINQPVKIDGNLDDAAWQSIEVATDFIISFPSFGKPANQKTEVKIVYDNSAVYVGAFMFDNTKEIIKGLTARDVIELQNTDYLVWAWIRIKINRMNSSSRLPQLEFKATQSFLKTLIVHGMQSGKVRFQ